MSGSRWGDDREVWSWSGYFGERLYLFDEPPRGDEPRTVLLQVVDGNGHESSAISMTPEHARQLAAELTRWADRG